MSGALPAGSVKPEDSLLLLAQFAKEYLDTLADRPATQGACRIQIVDCVQRIEAALAARPAQPPAPLDGDTTDGTASP